MKTEVKEVTFQVPNKKQIIKDVTLDLIEKFKAEHGDGLLHGFWVFVSNMIKCMMCASTWIGFFYGIFLYSPVHEILGVTPWASWFFDGMLASGSVWAINAIIEWYELNRPKQD